MATLRLGLQDFLKAQIVGGIIVNLLLVLGVAMLLGGLRYHLQAYSTISARSYSSLMLLAIVALLFPSAYVAASPQFDTHRLVVLSVCVALVLLITYVLYLVFSLRTHKDVMDTPEEVEAVQTSLAGHCRFPSRPCWPHRSVPCGSAISWSTR